MALENDIQTLAFENEWHKLRVNLLFSASWLEGEVKQFLDPFGITQKQFNILRILRGWKEELAPTILDVRERMIDKMSDASRLVDRLEKKGLLEKVPCTMDKRAVRLHITENGKVLLASIALKNQELDLIPQNLSLSEAEDLNHLLEKMRAKTSP